MSNTDEPQAFYIRFEDVDTRVLEYGGADPVFCTPESCGNWDACPENPVRDTLQFVECLFRSPADAHLYAGRVLLQEVADLSRRAHELIMATFQHRFV